MKSFSKYIAEVAEPINPEEKKFKDQHKPEVITHPVAEPEQFSGDIKKKPAKRKADVKDAEAKYDLAVEDLVYEAKEDDEPASPDEASMAKKQAEFLEYVGREVAEYVQGGKEFPEWMQNKLSAVHQAAKDLHATLGDHGDDMDEACSSKKYKKEELSTKQKKIDHNKNGKIDGHDLAMLRAKKKNEEVEQLDELSPDTLKSYDKKARADWSKAKTSAAKNKRAGNYKTAMDHSIRADQRKAGIEKAVKRLNKEEVEQLDELSPDTIKSYMNKAKDNGNKALKSRDRAKTTATRDKHQKTVDKRNKGLGSALKRDIAKKPEDRNYILKPSQHDRIKTGAKGHSLTTKKASELHPNYKNRTRNEEVELDETTSSAVKHMVTQTGPDGKTRTVMKKLKADRTDDRGQDQIQARESVEQIDEAFKKGIVKFDDGSSMVLKKEDVDTLNKMFKKMSSGSRKKMQETAMKDKKGFAEILDFAKQAN